MLFINFDIHLILLEQKMWNEKRYNTYKTDYQCYEYALCYKAFPDFSGKVRIILLNSVFAHREKIQLAQHILYYCNEFCFSSYHK